MTSTAPAASEPTRRLPWPVIYYLLAAFDILTVCISLYLNYSVTGLYVEAVASSQEWGQLLADDLALERLAAEVNDAGSDAFDSHDAAAGSKRMRTAQTAFAERVAALRKDLAASAPAGGAAALATGLAEIDRRMGRMAADAEALLTQVGHDPGAATPQRVALAGSYAELLTAFHEQRVRIGLARPPRPVRSSEPETPGPKLPRWERFQRQTSLAASLQRWEWVIAGLIVMMVMGAVFYGRHLALQMERDDQERRRSMDALSEARATLEQRVLERTEALRRSEAELRRAASEWQRTFEAIASPVLLLEADGRVVRVNRAAAELAGRPEEELPGSAVTALGESEPWRSAARLAAEVTQRRGSASAEVREGPNGKTWDIVANAVVEEGSGPRAIVVARDITRIIELQETLRREEQMAAMGSLVAGVAHEVRNPLFGISATLETLAARLGPDGSLERYFKALKIDVGRLRDLMQDLLDYGRPPRLRLTATPLEVVVGEAARACEVAAAGRSVDVQLAPELPELLVDHQRMVQVLENLIRNALQHSPDGSRVVVEADRDGAQAIWCRVRDFGPGFRTEDLPRLFEPFFSKREGGTGLGLSIAQRIVEQHGGRIAAENHPEGGAVVKLTLPLWVDGAAARPEVRA
jgi:PAS domain S-box-containing protein